MKRTFIIIVLIPFIFTFCKKQKENQIETSEVIASEEFVMIDESESIPSDVEHAYTIVLNINNPIDFEEYNAEISKVETEGIETDTIAVGCGGLAENEFAFAGRVELNSRWLAILFPNVENYNITKVRADIVNTKKYKEIENYGRDVTIHTIDPKYNSTEYDDRKPWDYDVAFKGDYKPSDFIYYQENVVSSEDTLRIHKLISQYCESEPSPLKNPECHKIYLKKIYSFDDDLYAALYFSETDDTTHSYPHLFLIKGDKVLLWKNSAFELRLHGFSLSGQNYIWTFEQDRHVIVNNLYKLNNFDLSLFYSIAQTD